MDSSMFEPNSNEFTSKWPYVAGLFALTAIFLSLFEIFKHMQYYNKPYLQKYIVRILWMVPIYALNSWLAMFFPQTSIYMDTLRECYEAFVIYSFMKYLFNFLQNDVDEYEILVDCKPSIPNNFPFCLLPPLPGGRRFIQLVRHAMIQYIVLRPITTFLALIFQIFGVYGEGHFSLNNGYIYLLIINNFSQMVAMYFLIMFYQNYKRELTPMRPLGKFLSIKAVIFFSFFQGVILTILIYLGIITKSFIPSTPDISTNEMSRNLQDFIICFEMLIAAIAHIFVFSHKPFIDEQRRSNPMFYSFSRIVDMTDERTDVADHFRQIGNRMKNIWTSSQQQSNYTNIENSITAPLIPMQVRKNYGSSREGFQKI
nr:transmembrane protein 184C-like [Dermatophagoides farinae]